MINTEDQKKSRLIGRRGFVAALAAVPAIIALGYAGFGITSDASDNSSEPDASGIVKVSVVEFTDSGERKGLVMEDKVVKTDEEWRKLLTPEQSKSGRKKGTERPFSTLYARHPDKAPIPSPAA